MSKDKEKGENRHILDLKNGSFFLVFELLIWIKREIGLNILPT